MKNQHAWATEIAAHWVEKIDDVETLRSWLDFVHERLEALGESRRGFVMQPGKTVRADGVTWTIVSVEHEVEPPPAWCDVGGFDHYVNLRLHRREIPA